MPMTIDERKQIILRCLALPPGIEADPGTVAEQSLLLWKQMAVQLIPLIGETGFQALYARAVHLTLPHCPGFALMKQCSGADGLFQRLKDDLAAMECRIAEQCSTILLNNFTDLVAAMIGEVLMAQILRSAWAA